MKLTANKLKQMISEAMEQRQSESMLLEEPNLDEMSTAASAAARVNVPDGYRIGDTGRIAKGFVFISADRKVGSDCKGTTVTPELNNTNMKKMKRMTKAAGFPFINIEGGWEEDTGPVVERSILIWDEPRGPDAPPPSIPIKQLAMDISQMSCQESFIHGFLTRDDDGNVYRTVKAYGADGSQQDWLQATSMEEVPEDAEFWSRIRGKGPKTQLKEEKDYIEVEAPNSVIEAMKKASQHKGKKIRFVRSKN